tara:strand:- start:160 stop:1122 length:963 start_codon:yes stop_codon:yes gene_type:complete
MKQLFFLLILLLLGCTSKSDSTEQKLISELDSVKSEELVIANLEQEEPQPKKKLYLNGIYEYDYPHDTEDMNENQYIAFKTEGDSVQGWYFGTSDEFDEAREGYLPGFFVSEIRGLTTKGDSLFFSVRITSNQCYHLRPPIGMIDTEKLAQEYEVWYYNDGFEEVYYKGKLDGLNIYIDMFGETRTYRKTKNYFHPGIDNYDSTKCNFESLHSLNQNLDSLSSDIVLDFLSTFSVICEANVEFGEWSNELLFKVLNKSPELTLRVLSENLNELDTTSIYRELESPLHDLIPVDSIRSKIETLKINEHVKTSVLQRLDGLN